jgi:hypothetical protein
LTARSPVSRRPRPSRGDRRRPIRRSAARRGEVGGTHHGKISCQDHELPLNATVPSKPG